MKLLFEANFGIYFHLAILVKIVSVWSKDVSFLSGCLHAVPCKWPVHHGGSGLKLSILHGWAWFHHPGQV